MALLHSPVIHDVTELLVLGTHSSSNHSLFWTLVSLSLKFCDCSIVYAPPTLWTDSQTTSIGHPLIFPPNFTSCLLPLSSTTFHPRQKTELLKLFYTDFTLMPPPTSPIATIAPHGSITFPPRTFPSGHFPPRMYIKWHICTHVGLHTCTL